jgi:hypothetical protein
MVIVGPLADFYFEPAMMMRGSLAPTFGWLVGTGPGAGMGLMILLSSIFAAIVGFAGYRVHVIRNVERIIPDADPKSRLAEYRKKLARAHRKGQLTEPQCREMYGRMKVRLESDARNDFKTPRL